MKGSTIRVGGLVACARSLVQADKTMKAVHKQRNSTLSVKNIEYSEDKQSLMSYPCKAV